MAQFKIKELMDAAGMNIQTFSDKTGVSRTTISSFYNGNSNGIQLATLEKFCQVLKATPNDLIELSSDKYVVVLDPQKAVSNQVVATVYSENDYNKMTDDDAAMVDLDDGEHKLFITKTTDLFHDDSYIRIAVGLPIEPTAPNARLSYDETFGLNHWLQSLSDTQRIELCRQSAFLYFKEFVGKIKQRTVAVSFNTTSNASPVYAYNIDATTGTITPISRPNDLDDWFRS